MSAYALVKLWLGPVQSFVASARTTRDVWTGSYLLAWLVREAARPIQNAGGEFMVPDTGAFGLAPNQLRTPTIPNHFTAMVAASAAGRLATECEQSAREAWANVCAAVHRELSPKVGKLPHHEGWDRLWSHQIRHFFDVRVITLETTDNLVGDLYRINNLMAAEKRVRHFPADTPSDHAVPGKCSLLGDLEQMGPPGLSDSTAFWEAFANNVTHSGSRVRSGERLCAVSLVKRFAWTTALSRRAQADAADLQMPDTARIAAAAWLNDAERQDLKQHAERQKSGAWLYWQRPDEGEQQGEEAVPPALWRHLQAARVDRPPPAYYAVLVLDGDKMGQRFRLARDVDSLRETSRRIGRFAREHSQQIIHAHHGTLVYCGGDDVLALLPLDKSIACARSLACAFADCVSEPGSMEPATVSCGMAVVHHKEDLRFALEQGREAERWAKSSGRNRLVLRICRRSGEHATAGLPWTACETLQHLTAQFSDGTSDRWAYKLRSVLEQLRPTGEATTASILPILHAELRRLLNRADDVGPDTKRLIETLLGELHSENSRRPEWERFRDFVVLCQSASFVARGRDR